MLIMTYARYTVYTRIYKVSIPDFRSSGFFLANFIIPSMLFGEVLVFGVCQTFPQEYVMICSEVGCDPTRGVDFRGFSQMVDDEEDLVQFSWETDSLRAPIHKGFPLPCSITISHRIHGTGIYVGKYTSHMDPMGIW